MGHIFGSITACVGGYGTDQTDSPVVKRTEGRDVACRRPSNQFVVGRLVGHYRNE